MDFKNRFVVLDIETTGITFEYFDEPTEIALIEVIDGKLTGNNKHFYLKPKKNVSINFLNKVFGKSLIKEYNFKDFASLEGFVENALKDKKYDKYSLEELNLLTNKINNVNEMSKKMYENIINGKSKYSILPEIRNFIGDSFVVAHNAPFDVNFLNYWFNNLKLPLINKYICTLINYKNHFGFKENNLGACCNYYGIALEGAHNALEDTIACANLFIKEIEEFSNEIVYFDLEEHISYANFKKRVMKTNYSNFAKNILSDSCNMPINIESLGQIEIDSCKYHFSNFKKPVDVAKFTGLDLGSVEAIFIDWVNCININKHQDLLKDRYLKDTINEVLYYSKRNTEKINEICDIMFETKPNYFYFKLVDKLENEKETMEYSLSDFDFYFNNLRDLNSLANKIGKDISYLFNFLLQWIGNDNQRFLKYKSFFKEVYGTPVGKILYDCVDNAENKIFIFRQLGIK